MPALEVRYVSKVYEGKVPHRALDNVAFDAEDGEFTGVMGPSGSGKTSLLNLIAAIDEPTSGEIRIAGTALHSLGSHEAALLRRRTLGFVFQHFHLLDTLTVEENIAVPLTLEGISPGRIGARVREVLERLGIADIAERRIDAISGGQMQRTAIARAIVHRPALILADEPTGNLDSRTSGEVMRLLEAVNREDRANLLMVTHDALAASFCHRVLFIKDGRLCNEIVRGSHRQTFYQRILDMQSLLGGERRDLPTTRG
nr:ABC transporter ATP-binding protein [Paenibacillus sabuli]